MSQTHWHQAPDSDRKLQNYRIWRTPASRQETLICLSPAHIGAKLHYWKGRSRPCPGTNCEACMDGQIPRWKGYVLVYHESSKGIAIFEFTERGYDPFATALQRHGTLRGLKFQTSRLGRRPNGPLLIEFSETREESPHLPADVDLAAMLDRIWEIRQQTLDFQGLTT